MKVENSNYFEGINEFDLFIARVTHSSCSLQVFCIIYYLYHVYIEKYGVISFQIRARSL